MGSFLKKLFGRFASSKAPEERQVYLAAFGKHPGWDDHVELGVDTPALIDVRRVLYVDGIGGNVESGAWDRLQPAHRLERFGHTFVWRRPEAALIGRLWASSDGKGRTRYPLVVCADCCGLGLDWGVEHVPGVLERLRAECLATPSADGVRAAVHDALMALRSALSGGAAMWGGTPVSKGEFAPHVERPAAPAEAAHAGAGQRTPAHAAVGSPVAPATVSHAGAADVAPPADASPGPGDLPESAAAPADEGSGAAASEDSAADGAGAEGAADAPPDDAEPDDAPPDDVPAADGAPPATPAPLPPGWDGGGANRAVGFLAARPDGQPGNGLAGVLYQLMRDMGSDFRIGNPEQAARILAEHPVHLRLPARPEAPVRSARAWVRFLRAQLGSLTPLMTIQPDEADWLDVIAGAPGPKQLFCLMAGPGALPLTTDIPYNLEPDFVRRANRYLESGR